MEIYTKMFKSKLKVELNDTSFKVFTNKLLFEREPGGGGSEGRIMKLSIDSASSLTSSFLQRFNCQNNSTTPGQVSR